MNCGFAYLSVFWRKTIETFLDDMISVEVLNQLYDSILKRIDNHLDLCRISSDYGKSTDLPLPAHGWK